MLPLVHISLLSSTIRNLNITYLLMFRDMFRNLGLSTTPLVCINVVPCKVVFVYTCLGFDWNNLYRINIHL